MSEKKYHSAQLYVESLQGAGRYSFTSKDVAGAVNGSEVALQAALMRLKKKGRVISPRRGFFVVVPVEYRSAGSPPASWFINELMAYLDQPYYVGLLSAAAIHGASHQQPQVFQVLTDLPTRPVEMSRIRIEFHRNRRVGEVPVEQVKTETGTMSVSTPEATAIDLIRYPEASGHLDNVATVLSELAAKIDPSRLRQLAARARHSDVQRLGFMLEKIGLSDLAAPLAAFVGTWRKRVILLRPDRESGGLDPHPCWFVIPNEEVRAEA